MIYLFFLLRSVTKFPLNIDLQKILISPAASYYAYVVLYILCAIGLNHINFATLPIKIFYRQCRKIDDL